MFIYHLKIENAFTKIYITCDIHSELTTKIMVLSSYFLVEVTSR